MKIFKKILCAIIIAVLCLTFVGCGDETVEDPVQQLATPENVVCSDTGLITWNEVEHADYYIVVHNGNNYRTNTNSYQVGSVINDFTYAVIAAADEGRIFKNSNPSETQTFKGKGVTVTIDPMFEGLNVSITGNQLVGSGRSTQLTAVVNYPDGNSSKRIKWSVVDGASYGSIDDKGMFTAAEVTEDHDVTVRATSTDNEEKYAELVIGVMRKPDLTEKMLDSVKDDYIGFEGYMDIDLYTFALVERYVQTVHVYGISTSMNGERWHASYLDSSTGYTNELNYKKEKINAQSDVYYAQQVALSLMNDEEYFPMTDERGDPVSWEAAGLYNNFKTLTIGDFEFDEEDWRYYYKGTNAALLQNMVASSNPYEFEAERFGLIIEDGELLGIYAESKPSLTVIQGYKSYEKLYAYVNCGRDTVTVPDITKFEHNPQTVGGGRIDHDTLGKAIENMQALENYKMDFMISTHFAGGYSISGFYETVIEGDYFFQPYNVSTYTYLREMQKGAEYGFHKLDYNTYNSYYYYAEDNEGIKTESYEASRAYEGDMTNAKASFAFAPEIFNAYASTTYEGKAAKLYLVDESMCHVATTFYYGVGNDMPLYGLFAMYYPYLATSTPYVVVQDGHIVQTYFFYFLGDMYGEVVINYTDFNKAEMPESFKAELFENYVPRVVPSSWSELTVINRTNTGNGEEVNLLEFLADKRLLGSTTAVENLPFFGDVLGDTFGFALGTHWAPGGSNKSVVTVMLYYDVPLDTDRSIESSMKKVQELLVKNQFTKNQYGEYVKGDISVKPVDSSLDFLIYVWKTV